MPGVRALTYSQALVFGQLYAHVFLRRRVAVGVAEVTDDSLRQQALVVQRDGLKTGKHKHVSKPP